MPRKPDEYSPNILGNNGRLEDIRQAFKDLDDDEFLDNDDSDLVLPTLGIIAFALPAAIPLLYPRDTLPFSRPLAFIAAVGLIGLGIAVYLFSYLDVLPEPFSAGQAGDQDEPAEVYDLENSEDLGDSVDDEFESWPWTFPTREDLKRKTISDIEGNELRVLLTEYEQVSEEARYRDRLFNRSMYFGMAIIALLAASTSQAQLSQVPAVLMASTLATFVFAMVITKYKDARDPLWKRQRDLERLIPAFRGRLTTFHTIRTPERRSYDKLSFTTFLVNLYTGLWILSLLFYVLSLTIWLFPGILV